MSQNETTNPVSSAEAPVSLNLADLRSFCQIVEVCTQRGAFRAEEMADVGALYNKTMAFLKQTGALAATNEAPKEPEQDAN